MSVAQTPPHRNVFTEVDLTLGKGKRHREVTFATNVRFQNHYKHARRPAKKRRRSMDVDEPVDVLCCREDPAFMFEPICQQEDTADPASADAETILPVDIEMLNVDLSDVLLDLFNERGISQ